MLFLLCGTSTILCRELEKHSTVSAFRWRTDLQHHTEASGDAREAFGRQFDVDCRLQLQTAALDIWQSEDTRCSQVFFQCDSSVLTHAFNESEEPLFRLLINTQVVFFLLLLLSVSKQTGEHLVVQFTTTRCVCVDILRWEHASFELPRHSTWRVENLPVHPLQKQTFTGKQNGRRNISYITLTPLLIYTSCANIWQTYNSVLRHVLSYENNMKINSTVTYKSSSPSIQSAKTISSVAAVLFSYTNKRKLW